MCVAATVVVVKFGAHFRCLDINFAADKENKRKKVRDAFIRLLVELFTCWQISSGYVGDLCDGGVKM